MAHLESSVGARTEGDPGRPGDPDRMNVVREFYNDGMVRVSAFTHAIQDLKAVVYNW